MVSTETAVLGGLAVLAIAAYAVGGVLIGPGLGVAEGADLAPDAGSAGSHDYARSFDPLADSVWNDSVDWASADFAFEEVSQQRGLYYTSAHTYNSTQESISNSGVYVADYDNDGWTDVLATGATQPTLYENEQGQFRATDHLPAIDGIVQSALFVDYDADGWRDLILFVVEGEPVVLENVEGTYERRPDMLETTFRFPQGATAADFDGDGCPGLFVYQYGHWGVEHPLGQRNYTVDLERDNGYANSLFEGDCDGFTNVTEDAGVRGTAWSLAASAVDLDDDGRPEVHVTNDFNYDVLYDNRGDGTFENRTLGERTNRNGMSSEVADVTGDGSPDIFVTNIYFPEFVRDEIEVSLGLRAVGNNLLVNHGDGTFAERAAEWGVRKGGWAWAATLSDFDNDGDRDLFHATRMTSRNKLTDFFLSDDVDTIQRYYRFPVIRERTGDGFQRLNPAELGFNVSNGRGVAALDYDHDGDLDLLLADANGPLYLYENTHEGNTSLEVALRSADGRTALGASVEVTATGETQTRLHNVKADFLSQDSTTLHVGTGTAARADVTVTWADGSTTTVTDVSTNQRLVVRPDGRVATMQLAAS